MSNRTVKNVTHFRRSDKCFRGWRCMSEFYFQCHLDCDGSCHWRAARWTHGLMCRTNETWTEQLQGACFVVSNPSQNPRLQPGDSELQSHLWNDHVCCEWLQWRRHSLWTSDMHCIRNCENVWRTLLQLHLLWKWSQLRFAGCSASCPPLQYMWDIPSVSSTNIH